MRKISAVGLFCSDKFEETPKQEVIDLSKLNKFYFSIFFILTEVNFKVGKDSETQIGIVDRLGV